MTQSAIRNPPSAIRDPLYGRFRNHENTKGTKETKPCFVYFVLSWLRLGNEDPAFLE